MSEKMDGLHENVRKAFGMLSVAPDDEFELNELHENVRKVFEMLGVEPNEEFTLSDAHRSMIYKVSSVLEVSQKCVLLDVWEEGGYGLSYLLSNTDRIIKLQKPIKLTRFEEQEGTKDEMRTNGNVY